MLLWRLVKFDRIPSTKLVIVNNFQIGLSEKSSVPVVIIEDHKTKPCLCPPSGSDLMSSLTSALPALFHTAPHMCTPLLANDKAHLIPFCSLSTSVIFRIQFEAKESDSGPHCSVIFRIINKWYFELSGLVFGLYFWQFAMLFSVPESLSWSAA